MTWSSPSKRGLKDLVVKLPVAVVFAGDDEKGLEKPRMVSPESGRERIPVCRGGRCDRSEVGGFEGAVRTERVQFRRD
jgi:hypothetical protein